MGLDFFEDVDDADFGAMLEGEGGEIKSGFTPGEKVSGTVIEITSNSILVDVKATSEGIIDRSQFEEDGELTVSVGDTVDAFFAGVINGEIILTGKMKSQDADRAEQGMASVGREALPCEHRFRGRPVVDEPLPPGEGPRGSSQPQRRRDLLGQRLQLVRNLHGTDPSRASRRSRIVGPHLDLAEQGELTRSILGTRHRAAEYPPTPAGTNLPGHRRGFGV